jgi:hypothetical protein
MATSLLATISTIIIETNFLSSGEQEDAKKEEEEEEEEERLDGKAHSLMEL